MKSNKQERPVLKLELTLTDRLLEVLGWLILIFLWTVTLLDYSGLPDTIPTHFDFAGKPNDFGSKMTIFALPVFGTLMFVGMTILNRFPHIFNYPTKITDQNARRLYTIATRLLRYLKLMIVLIYSVIVLMTTRSAEYRLSGPGKWFLPLFMGVIFIPLIYAIIKLFKSA